MKTYTTEDIVKASSKGLMHNIELLHKASVIKAINRLDWNVYTDASEVRQILLEELNL